MQNQQNEEKYYMGLDIGTDSVGYAVTDFSYKLLRHGGEPLIGTHLFDAAEVAADRRGFRTARRRLDRRQERVRLIREIFAGEIAGIDADFYRRLDSSALWQEDKMTPSGNSFFNDPNYTDRDYHREYPTIHHLICDLIRDTRPQDVRLVYLAVAYLVAHRGHFLNQVDKNDIGGVMDFGLVYGEFTEYFRNTHGTLPWDTDADALQTILKSKIGVSAKEKALVKLLFGGKKPGVSEDESYDRALLVKLLAGGQVKVEKLFGNEGYAEIGSVSLAMAEDAFVAVLDALGEDGELLLVAKKIYDWSILADLTHGCELISEAKVRDYEQHRKDLTFLKHFVRTYLPKKAYYDVFRSTAVPGNYVSYAYHDKSGGDRSKLQKVTKQVFCEHIFKLVRNVDVADEDREQYVDMLARLDKSVCSFMPKQVDGDNRVIPYQLYYVELKQLLDTTRTYLPFLDIPDEDGVTPYEKILSVFEFRVPYFVGPLNPHDPQTSWICRRGEGKIYPWNFETMVDLDASEEAFIDRMTNSCTYLAGESVLAQNSLLYTRFMVLNEINNIKINGEPITVPCKQHLFDECFLRYPRVTRKRIEDFLRSAGYMQKGDSLSGLDETVKSSLRPYHFFKAYMESGQLTEADVEWILERQAYVEDNFRFRKNLEARFPALSEGDCRRIVNQPFKNFGRLSQMFLCELQGTKCETGEIMTVMDVLWNTNDNLMQILSDCYTFREQVEAWTRDYYATTDQSLTARLNELYISNAVKRPIIRALDIVRDVVRVNGTPPAKIFVEMARGATEDQKNKRTISRRAQILEFYNSMEDSDELHFLREQLEKFEDRELRGEKLYLYFIQLGKCMYSGEPIRIEELSSNQYNVDHIYPQSAVKDDSIHNKVLVLSGLNGEKSNEYPIRADIRHKMKPFWEVLKEKGLISDEKFKRLTRPTPFTEDERWGFINRQLVETRQSTKAVATLLQELYPDTEIVYVKAGLVSEFRQQFGFWKSRSVNDLHHAKDAYLNIVVGNVYHSVFTRAWFLKRPNDEYSINVKTLFKRTHKVDEVLIWDGERSLAFVRKTMEKDHIHLTRYAFCRHGGFFDQMPLKAGTNHALIPRKAGLDPFKYGGYNKTTATYFILVRFRNAKKTDLMIMPVELLYARQFETDSAFAEQYTIQTIATITGKAPTAVEFPLGMRKIKVNTVLELDGCRVFISGKSNGGKMMVISSLTSIRIGTKWETYVKHLESFAEKRKNNPNLHIHSRHDHITAEENCAVYDVYREKLRSSLFRRTIGENVIGYLDDGAEAFRALLPEDQVAVLLVIVSLLKTGRKGGCDLTKIGGKPTVGVLTLSSTLSNWKKKYTTAYIVDSSASGLYETKSSNLLDLL